MRQSKANVWRAPADNRRSCKKALVILVPSEENMFLHISSRVFVKYSFVIKIRLELLIRHLLKNYLLPRNTVFF